MPHGRALQGLIQLRADQQRGAVAASNGRRDCEKPYDDGRCCGADPCCRGPAEEARTVQNARRMKKLRRPAWFIAVAAAIILLPTWFYTGFTENAYVNRPRQPSPQAGWTTPYAVKGITVYVSETEAIIGTWLFRFDMGLIVLIVLCVWASGGKLGARPPNSN